MTWRISMHLGDMYSMAGAMKLTSDRHIAKSQKAAATAKAQATFDALLAQSFAAIE